MILINNYSRNSKNYVNQIKSFNKYASVLALILGMAMLPTKMKWLNIAFLFSIVVKGIGRFYLDYLDKRLSKFKIISYIVLLIFAIILIFREVYI